VSFQLCQMVSFLSDDLRNHPCTCQNKHPQTEHQNGCSVQDRLKNIGETSNVLDGDDYSSLIDLKRFLKMS
jgi:hypothetical protein